MKTPQPDVPTCVSRTNSAARRRLLQSLAVGGLASGLIPKKWTKPVVDSVLLPLHAATTATSPVVMNSGNNNITLQRDATGPGGLLDVLIGPAYAVQDLLTGGCLKLTVDGTTAIAELTLNNSASNTATGSVSGTAVNVSGLHGQYSLTGTLDNAAAPTSASGSISGNGGGHNFSVSVNNPACSPVAPVTPVCGDSIGATAISGNHPSPYTHAIMVPFADVQAGVTKTYQLGNSLSHFHDVVVTSADMTSLLAGSSVTITSSSSQEHVHQVTLLCGTAG